MQFTEKDIVGQIVAQDYRAADVFNSYGIDFCCRGNRSLEEVAQHNNIEVGELVGKLNSIQSNTGNDQVDYQSWELDLLADYIEKKHHRFTRRRIPEIEQYLNKIVQVHGDRHPELAEIATHFQATKREMTEHMEKEESILFPHIRSMIEAELDRKPLESAEFGSVDNPIQEMMEEHDHEGIRFREISALSNGYTPPADACNTYRVTYQLLKEFEQDLHLHIHLENNILFPKAAEMEKRMQTNATAN